MGPPWRPLGHVPPKPAGRLEPGAFLREGMEARKQLKHLGAVPEGVNRFHLPRILPAVGRVSEGLLLRNDTDCTEISWLLRSCGRGGLEHVTHWVSFGGAPRSRATPGTRTVPPGDTAVGIGCWCAGRPLSSRRFAHWGGLAVPVLQGWFMDWTGVC